MDIKFFRSSQILPHFSQDRTKQEKQNHASGREGKIEMSGCRWLVVIKTSLSSTASTSLLAKNTTIQSSKIFYTNFTPTIHPNPNTLHECLVVWGFQASAEFYKRLQLTLGYCLVDIIKLRWKTVTQILSCKFIQDCKNFLVETC